MNDTVNNLNERQAALYQIIIGSDKPLTRQQIEGQVPASLKASRVTTIRDLNVLKKLGLIADNDKNNSPTTRYSAYNRLLEVVDVDAYYTHEFDARKLVGRPIHDFLDLLSEKSLLSNAEKIELTAANDAFRIRSANYPPELQKKELERFVIELAWKSSAIEGNTYSILETETLLKYGIPSKKHTTAETRMIINHKRAFDYIVQNRETFAHLGILDIIDLHKILIDQLNVDNGLRKVPVQITGTNYLPPSGELLLREYLERMIDIVNQKEHPVEKAIIAGAFVAYLQPFADGNKRTSRLLSNALLLANEYCPLSYRNISEEDYKKAILLVDEQQNLYYFKNLVIGQFNYAAENYLAI
ncbi:MAG: Fic family protein [Candidatus Nomurabacteria bacterium]|jgi:Fic family protein|nr:Fic family protein [Candidatus Nomurabacteria bacterium]